MALVVIGFFAFIALAIYEINGGSASGGTTGLLQQVEGQVSDVINGGNLTPSQIAGYASAAGFTGDDLVTAVAIAMAESGGNPMAYNPETAANTPTGLGSVGLWQIYLKAHPEFAGIDLTNPTNNAAAAFAVYQAAGNRFTPWSTFGNGAYAGYVTTARSAVNT